MTTSMPDAVRQNWLACPRVSSAGQEIRGYSLPTQLTACEELAGSQGGRVVASLPWTGSGTRRRDSWREQVMAGLRARTFGTVVFHDVDRASRRGALHLFGLLEEIERNGGQWRVVVNGDRYNDPQMGPVFLAWAAQLARTEIEQLKERVNRGIGGRLDGATDGVRRPSGTGTPPLGLAWGDARRSFMVVVEAEWAVVEQAFELVARLRSLRATARALNAAGYRTRRGRTFTPEAVGDLIRNPTYKGELHSRRHTWVVTERDTVNRQERPVSERSVLEGAVRREAGDLINPERWTAANAAIQPRALAPRPFDPARSLLSGRIVCGVCGQSAGAGSAGSAGGPVAQYRCNHAGKVDETRCAGCGTMQARLLDDEVWSVLVPTLADESLWRAAYVAHLAGEQPRADRAAAQRAALATLERQYTTAVKELALGDLSERRRAALRAELTDLERQLDEGERELAQLVAAAEPHTATAAVLADWPAWAARLAALAASATPAERRLLMEAADVAVALYRPGTAPSGDSGRRWAFTRLRLPAAVLGSSVSVSAHPSIDRHSDAAADALYLYP